jgi:hypothetical protein
VAEGTHQVDKKISVLKLRVEVRGRKEKVYGRGNARFLYFSRSVALAKHTCLANLLVYLNHQTLPTLFVCGQSSGVFAEKIRDTGKSGGSWISGSYLLLNGMLHIQASLGCLHRNTQFHSEQDK